MIVFGCLLALLSALAQTNADEHCVMFGNCGIDDMTLLKRPCAYNGSPVPLSDPSTLSRLKKICPTLNTGNDYSVCCDSDQIQEFGIQLDALAALFKRCPSCFHNLANLFCQLMCSPTQSSFLEVTATGKNNSVTELKSYIKEDFAAGLFDSCKNVKLGDTSNAAIEIACGVHTTDCTPHRWLEYMGSYGVSPYQTNFHFETTSKVTVNEKTFYPMSETIIPCSQPVTPGGPTCTSVDCPRI